MKRVWMLIVIALALVGCAAELPTATPAASATPASAAAAPTATAPLATATALSAPALAVRGTIAIDGSSTVFPITEAMARLFQQRAPNVNIQLGVSGTGGGFKTFCAGETVISDASRPIKAAEAAKCAAAGIDYIELPIGFDGISVVLHPANDWATCMTVAELKMIWEPSAAGRITRWSQIRPGWPDQPLELYGAGVDSGTYDYFTSAIVGAEGVSRQDYIGSEDDYLIVQDIMQKPGSLGFFGYAYYREFQDKLGIVAIDNGSGCVAPSETTINTGTYQPLSRPIFIYVRRSALTQPAVAAFIEFYLAHVADVVPEVGYAPLPPRAYTLVQQRLERQVTGSVFSGGSQVGVSIEDILALEDQ